MISANINSTTSHSTIRSSMNDLISELLRLRTPHLPVSAEQDHLLNVADHLREVAGLVDRYIAVVGKEIASSTPHNIDQSLFDRQLFGALDGNALFEIERAADTIAEDNAQFGAGS